MSRIIAELVTVSIFLKISVSQDPTCSNGVIGSYAGSSYCCESSCIECDQDGCGNRGLQTDCCPSNISLAGYTCSSSNAPCKGVTTIQPTPATSPPAANPTNQPLPSSDPYCLYGIRHHNMSICCSATCPKCGGSGCGKNPYSCCTGKIKERGRSCDDLPAPCVISPTPRPTDAPTDPTIHPTLSPSYNPTNPSYRPTNAPSYGPTNEPLYEPTNEPSYGPTNEPSTAPSNSSSIHPTIVQYSNLTAEIMAIISILSFCLLCLIFCVIRDRLKRNWKMEPMTQHIHNPMVISIGIGKYDQNPNHTLMRYIGGYFEDLEGIIIDIRNAIQLFEAELCYDIFPRYDNIAEFKQQWTKQEIMDFLSLQGQILEDDIIEYDHHGNKIKDGYDGLVVIISCHGIEDYIITSDDHKISKTTIHRLFSKDHPKCRLIPRLFVFDCCNGSHEIQSKSRGHSLLSYLSINSYQQSQRVNDIDESKAESVSSYGGGWYQKEVNPDFNLAIVHSSNTGFQSKMRRDIGSYTITKLIEKLKCNLDTMNKRDQKFLYQILEEIQADLHSKCKQLPVFTLNNGTGYIKFVQRKIQIRKYVQVLSQERCHSMGKIKSVAADSIESSQEYAIMQSPMSENNHQIMEIDAIGAWNEVDNDYAEIEMEIMRKMGGIED